MADIFSRRQRSAVMSAIRSHGNAATELRLIAIFRAHGFAGWRRGASLRRKVEGGKLKSFRVKPDFVFRAQRLAVFVDGCSRLRLSAMAGKSGTAVPSMPRSRKPTPRSGAEKSPPTAPATGA